MTNPERIGEEEIKTYKVINNTMVEDITNILKEIEEFFISSGIKKQLSWQMRKKLNIAN